MSESRRGLPPEQAIAEFVRRPQDVSRGLFARLIRWLLAPVLVSRSAQTRDVVGLIAEIHGATPSSSFQSLREVSGRRSPAQAKPLDAVSIESLIQALHGSPPSSRADSTGFLRRFLRNRAQRKAFRQWLWSSQNSRRPGLPSRWGR